MAAEPEVGRTRKGPKVRLWEKRMSWEERRQQRKFRTSGQISREHSLMTGRGYDIGKEGVTKPVN